MTDYEKRPRGWGAVVVGVLLIAIGVAFFAVQTLGIEIPLDLGRIGWPLYVVAPGLVLLVAGLVMRDEPGAGLAIAGAIVTTIGGLLAYQWVSGHWSSWAYAWALVAPGSVGAAMVTWGLLHGRNSLVRSGLGTLAVGLIIFLVAFGFFEGLLNVGGERGLAPLGRQALPLALIVAGALIIVSRFWPVRRDEAAEE